MINQSQFFTRHRPWLQAGPRQKSFNVYSPNIQAEWTGASRVIARLDISGSLQIQDVLNKLSAVDYVAVSVVTWDANNTVTANIPVTEHYMIRAGTSAGLQYIPPYTNQRLKPSAYLYFWSAPPTYGTNAVTAFEYEIFAQGSENPFDQFGYVNVQNTSGNPPVYKLYTVDYPVTTAPIINTNFQQLS